MLFPKEMQGAKPKEKAEGYWIEFVFRLDCKI